MSIKAKPLDGLVPFWHVPEGQGDNDAPTEFNLKPLDGMQHAEVYAECKIADGMVTLSSSAIQLCLKYGLVGWKNFNDDEGQPIGFSRNNIRTVPGDTLLELATRVFNSSYLTAGQEKNS